MRADALMHRASLFLTQTHLPGYVDRIEDVKAAGAEEVAVVCVNDPWRVPLPGTRASSACHAACASADAPLSAARHQGHAGLGQTDGHGGQGESSSAARGRQLC